MIQTANDNPDRDPKNWNIVDSNDNVIHSVEDENQKDRFEEKKYRLDGEGAWTDVVTLNISNVQENDDGC